MKILKGSTWENLCLRKTFRGGTFSGWKYFQPLKVHLAICWRILKSGCAGLKVWRIVWRSLTENGLRSPGDKGREFFPSAHHGMSRQYPPMNDSGTGETSRMLFLRFICSRIAVWTDKRICNQTDIQTDIYSDTWLYIWMHRRINGYSDKWLCNQICE